MTDDPVEQLEDIGKSAVPTVDPGFADRLESQLRANHADQSSVRLISIPSSLPRLAAAALVVIVGVVGVIALMGQGEDVSVRVGVDGDIAPAGEPPTGVEERVVFADASSTPEPSTTRGAPVPNSTSTPESAITVVPSPTAQVAPAGVAPTATVVPRPSATVVVAPTATVVVAPTATLVPRPSATVVVARPSATVVVTPTATVVARPSATVVARPSATVVARPSATVVARPSATVVPAGVEPPELACALRRQGGGIAVSCEWTPTVAPSDISAYRLIRSRNGGEPEVVATIRDTAARTYLDRDVRRGDELIYLVRTFAGDAQVSASQREVLTIPWG